jgi:Fe-S cluster assembly iron-binding protein IscA
MNQNDTLIESQEIKVVYNSNLEEQVNNCVVDYANSWFERGFVIRGARTSSC